MTILASFNVYGVPKPQGSKRAFVIPGKNGAKSRAAMTETAGVAGAQWRDAVAQAAKNEADRILDSGVVRELAPQLAPPFDGALGLTVEFRFPMPKSRSRADRERGHNPKTTAPDLSKLVRSLEDALQAAGLIVDDARFYDIFATKWEIAEGWTGASVRIVRRETTS